MILPGHVVVDELDHCAPCAHHGRDVSAPYDVHLDDIWMPMCGLHMEMFKQESDVRRFLVRLIPEGNE